jgi:hypothetical protein
MRLAAMLVLACGFGAPSVASAQPASVSCTLFEVTPSTGAKPAMDSALQPIANKLSKPPFATWNVFRLDTNLSPSLVKGNAQTLTLKSGKATLFLRDHAQQRALLEITVDDAAGKRILQVNPTVPDGQWFITVTNDKSNNHLLALSCK